MAVFTHLRCLDVRHAFAGRVRAVVTTAAIAGDIHVIEIRRCPTRGRVAIVAAVAGVEMRRILAGGR